MNKIIFGLCSLLAAYTTSFSQGISIVKISAIENLLTSKSDKIQIVNFWATWCAPCVKEMSLFEKINGTDKTAKVTLVSLDLQTDDSQEKIYKFAERKKITSTIFILDEPDANSWIDKIDTRWSGALPATIVINTLTRKRKFIERELKEGELEELIKQVK